VHPPGFGTRWAFYFRKLLLKSCVQIVTTRIHVHSQSFITHQNNAQYPEGIRFLIEDIGVWEILPRRYNIRVLRNQNVEIRIATVGCTST
jgi:hypothetical protein